MVCYNRSKIFGAHSGWKKRLWQRIAKEMNNFVKNDPRYSLIDSFDEFQCRYKYQRLIFKEERESGKFLEKGGKRSKIKRKRLIIHSPLNKPLNLLESYPSQIKKSRSISTELNSSKCLFPNLNDCSRACEDSQITSG
ncbi:unnamed protein product [Moneuplotes crassus]|uniref:Uncharacterized protein n=1 Tax=Euplotes crassus TaxID=5936 RepID=A0AAD1UHQ2_EUPCR|nr:unnamed protein product [Moneuplotes crassus]